MFSKNDSNDTVKLFKRPLTFDDELDLVRRLSNDVLKCTFINPSIRAFELPDLNSVPTDANSLRWLERFIVLVPSQRRLGRRVRLAKHIDRFPLLLYQEARRDFADDRRCCKKLEILISTLPFRNEAYRYI